VETHIGGTLTTDVYDNLPASQKFFDIADLTDPAAHYVLTVCAKGDNEIYLTSPVGKTEYDYLLQLDAPSDLKVDSLAKEFIWGVVNTSGAYPAACAQYEVQREVLKNGMVLTVGTSDGAAPFSLDIDALKQEGEYLLRVRALGDGDKYTTSAWSDPIRYDMGSDWLTYSLAAAGGYYSVSVNTQKRDALTERYDMLRTKCAALNERYDELSPQELTELNNMYAEMAKIQTELSHVYIAATQNNLPVTTVKDSAFEGSSDITDVVIPENITHIGPRAFALCTGLKTISLPDSLRAIGSEAFYKCTALTAVTLPRDLEVIGNSSFAECTRLSNIRLEAVNCNDLTPQNHAFYKAGQPQQIHDDPSKTVNVILTVTVGANVTKIPAYLFCPLYDINAPHQQGSGLDGTPVIKKVIYEGNSANVPHGAHAFCGLQG
jgi:hypothetical protein